MFFSLLVLCIQLVAADSLVVDYIIFVANDNSDELEEVKNTQIEMMISNTIEFGAPVLDFEQNDADIVSDGVVSAAGHTPVIITQTITNSGANFIPSEVGIVKQNTKMDFVKIETIGAEFVPNISIVEEQIPEISVLPVVQPHPAYEEKDYHFVLGAFVMLICVLLTYGVRVLVNIYN